MRRRRFLSSSLAVAATFGLGARLSFGAERNPSNARLVFILMRGALDGLSVVPPYGDPAYAALRRELAIGAPGKEDGAIDLDGTFGLHPALGFLAESYAKRELAVVHAVATPYRERSHFDGQDLLENGTAKPHAVDTGWLNRALFTRANAPSSGGIALGQNVPLAMRGPADVASWSPTRLAAVESDTLDRLADRYASDPLLARRLADALSANAIATRGAQEQMATGAVPERATPYLETIRAAGTFLARADGPRVAMLDTTGWDTHANEGGARGVLATRLGVFDRGLRTLRVALADAWPNTVVILATEFGRTAAVNGTRGTDHGTGAAAFVLGGAVRGGRVVADWPGLDRASLHEGRDLKPTLDLRAVLKGVLREHLAITDRALSASVFPGSEEVLPVQGLVHT